MLRKVGKIVREEMNDAGEVNSSVVALVIRGDHELNKVKAEKLVEVACPLEMAEGAEIKALVVADPGFFGAR